MFVPLYAVALTAIIILALLVALALTVSSRNKQLRTAATLLPAVVSVTEASEVTVNHYAPGGGYRTSDRVVIATFADTQTAVVPVRGAFRAG